MDIFHEMNKIVKTQKILIGIKAKLVERDSESESFGLELLELSYAVSHLEEFQQYYLGKMVFDNE